MTLFASREASQPLLLDILLVHGFSLMSLAATMEPLRAANRVSGRPLYEWTLVSSDGRPAVTSSKVAFPVARALDKERTGDALLVVAAFEPLKQAASILPRLRAIGRRGIPLGGIESGSWILARAGLLDGHKATIHWEDIEEFAAAFPAVNVVSDRYVVDRDRFTAGGATPALDMMLDLIRTQHGMTIALNVASVFIYDREHLPADPQRIVSVGRLGFIEPRLAEAIKLMERSIDEPLSIAVVAEHVGLSARSLQSLFLRQLGIRPHAYFMEMRLSFARRLLLQTGRTIIDIASASGFSSATSFARAFRRRFAKNAASIRQEGMVAGARNRGRN